MSLEQSGARSDAAQPDQLWGAEAIAAEINRTPRQTWYLMEKRHLPAKKVGGQWTASRAALRKHLRGEAA